VGNNYPYIQGNQYLYTVLTTSGGTTPVLRKTRTGQQEYEILPMKESMNFEKNMDKLIKRSCWQESDFRETSKYQWLPAIYTVDENNKVKVTSYINNLEQEVTWYVLSFIY
jgi:hypothetical protein